MCPAIVSGIATGGEHAGQLMVIFRPQRPSPGPSNSPRSLPFLVVPLVATTHQRVHNR